MFDENFYTKLQLEEEAQQSRIANDGLEIALSGDHEDYSEGDSATDLVSNVARVW